MTNKEQDKIQKLIKLANNNPNDNEANAAARMVCRMLKEYKFNQLTPETGKPLTYNDIRRTTEPFWKNKPPSNYETPFTEAQQAYYKYWTDRVKNYQNPFYYERKKDFWEEQEEFNKRRAEKYAPESKVRTCSKCGKDKETKRITNVFTCNECEWNEYQSQRGEPR